MQRVIRLKYLILLNFYLKIFQILSVLLHQDEWVLISQNEMCDIISKRKMQLEKVSQKEQTQRPKNYAT